MKLNSNTLEALVSREMGLAATVWIGKDKVDLRLLGDVEFCEYAKNSTGHVTFMLDDRKARALEGSLT